MTGQTPPPYGVPTLPGAAGDYAAASTRPSPTRPEMEPRTYQGPPSPQRSPLAVLTAIGFLILVLGLAYVWHEQQIGQIDTANLAGMQGDLRTLQQRLSQLEQKTTDLGPIDARIRALETKPAPDIQGAVAPLAARIDAFAAQEKATLDGLTAQVKSTLDGLANQQKSTLDSLATQQKTAMDAAASQQRTALAAATAQVQSTTETLASDTKQAIADLSGRVDALEKREGAAEQQSRALSDQSRQTAAAASRASLVQTAGLALDAGQPLGTIPGAPPAVARFATAKPPTLAALRLAYPDAAKAAAAASTPPTEGQSLASRMWQNAQALVTVRQGDQIIVGAPVAAALARAQSLIDVGDLPGAVAALHTLDGGAAQAMKPWLDQAQALLDARAGLAAMAHS